MAVKSGKPSLRGNQGYLSQKKIKEYTPPVRAFTLNELADKGDKPMSINVDYILVTSPHYRNGESLHFQTRRFRKTLLMDDTRDYLEAVAGS
jgi:hypothetical protein